MHESKSLNSIDNSTPDDVVEELHQMALDGLREDLDRLEVRRARAKRYNSAIAGEARALAKAVAALTCEVRQRERHARDLAAELSYQEKVDIIKPFISSLPCELRTELASWLVAKNSQG